MKSALLAKRYAKAVTDLIHGEKYSQLAKDLRFLQKVFSEQNENIKIINSFIFPHTERELLFKQILSGTSLQKIWHNLFVILSRRHKFILINDILSEMNNIILSSQNKEAIKLTMAKEQPAEVIRKIVDYLEKILEKQVVVDVNIDSSIIGGFIAQSRILTFDGTVAHNLQKFINSIPQGKI
ncbi:MAG: ATP synthase F1 subunit delta [Candidatus Cloacimonetes bacterium]|nr:ATP synthase F1 subunit delta [Candidatus Cloacimonadota bacterium]